MKDGSQNADDFRWFQFWFRNNFTSTSIRPLGDPVFVLITTPQYTPYRQNYSDPWWTNAVHRPELMAKSEIWGIMHGAIEIAITQDGVSNSAVQIAKLQNIVNWIKILQKKMTEFYHENPWEYWKLHECSWIGCQEYLLRQFEDATDTTSPCRSSRKEAEKMWENLS